MGQTQAFNQLGYRLQGCRFLAIAAGTCLSLGAAASENGVTESQYRETSTLQSAQDDSLSFDSISFPIESIAGEIRLQARDGWVWREGQTHRIVLRHDVDVILASHQFNAESANIWIRKLDENPEQGTTRYQAYAIFDEMRSADGTITTSAKRMPVRGVIDVQSSISLKLDARFDGLPPKGHAAQEFIEQSNLLYAQRVLGHSSSNDSPQVVSRPWSSQSDSSSSSPESITTTSSEAAANTPLNPADSNKPIFHPTGIFSVSIDGRVVVDGASSSQGSVITADGGVTIQYQDPTNRQWIDFKAERVVIYTRGSEPITGVARLGATQIEGIYLEGGVLAGDDQWAVRAPRMYLDVVNNKALMLDAVFWTVDQKTAMPLYVRAQSVRQTAKNEFNASKAKISNSAFFAPDLTIGVSDVKVTLNPTANADDTVSQSGAVVEGKNVTLNAGSVPILWIPGFKGDPSSFPLRQISVGDSNRSGLAFRTRWNALSLLKIDGPPGVDVDLNIDYFAERGFALGVSSDWQTREHRGELFSYLLFDDNGTDITSSGRKISRDGEIRGVIAAHDLWEFTQGWTLVSELSYASDEAFVPALFDDYGRTTVGFRNRLQLERLGDNSQLALELSTTLNDFIVPEHLLQSPGYQVNKVPEARFISLSKDLLPEFEPGLLTYSFEARAGMLRLSFSEVAASAYGFTTDSLADDAFGTTASMSLGDKFRAIGLDESTLLRLDTRHELAARFDLGHIRVVPFLVGRATAYDDSFDTFSPNQDDDVRFWGAAGVTVSTTISKVNDFAENRFFDIHRLRHVVEPSITIWGGDSNFDDSDLPIFDDDVEGLLRGGAVRAAVDQTWQTKRGGIGRWRDVDIFKLRSEYVWTSQNAGQSAIPDFFSSRPELSNPGEYIGTSAIWQPTEVLGFAGEVVYDLDADRTARASVGAIVEHRPGFTTSIEYREVQPLDATFASLNARYRLTDKYAVNTGLNYNFTLNDFQTFNAQVLRRFQMGSFGATIRYDNIRGETSFGFVFRPGNSSGDIPVDHTWGG